MKKIVNPFVTGGYIGPEYFCDRTDDTNHLLKAIASKRNITLISLRRMGKTGLLKHVMHHLESEKQHPAVVYIDLMPTTNAREMLNAVSSAVLRIRQDEKNFFEKILSLLAMLRPRLSYDSLSGQPILELSVENPADIQYGLNHLLSFISAIDKELVIIFDEFQQISRYPEGNMEQILRSVIQTFPAIPFIFSGSSKHMLEPMFGAAGRPFYQSAELMYLGPIDEKPYHDFVKQHFENGNKPITENAMSLIFEWTRLHTFYVQHICNLLYENDATGFDVPDVNLVFQQVLSSYEPMYANFMNLLPAHQFALLKAIAIENQVAKPTSGAFIHKHKLGTASSVKTSLTALAGKEMIVITPSGWQVYDVFFSRWLEYHFGS